MGVLGCDEEGEREGETNLRRPTVRVRHGRVSWLRCRGSRLGKGGSRVYDCYLVFAWSVSLSIPKPMSEVGYVGISGV
jgi:hypothetical protein